MKTAAFEKKTEKGIDLKPLVSAHFNAVTIACVFLVLTQRKQNANTCNEQEETPALSTVQLWTSGGVYMSSEIERCGAYSYI